MCLIRCMLKGICTVLMKKQCTYVQLYFEIGKTALEMHRMLRTAFVKNVSQRTDFWAVFSSRISANWPQAFHKDKNVETVHKLIEDQWHTILDTAGRLGLLWKKSVNCNGGLEDAKHICALCVSPPHWQAEAAAVSGCYQHGFGCLEFLFVYEDETKAISAPYSGFLYNSWTITDIHTQTSEKSGPLVLPAVVEMQDLLHKLWKGPLLQD